MYEAKRITRPEATDLSYDFARALSEWDEHGRAIPGTASVALRPRGEGYELCFPAELAPGMLRRVFNSGYDKGYLAGLLQGRNR